MLLTLVLILLAIMATTASTPTTPTTPTHSTVHQVDHLNIDAITPTPSSTAFQNCLHYIRGAQWTCWQDAENAYGIPMEEYLVRTELTGRQCCAFWFAEQCIAVKRATYEDCTKEEVVRYWARVHQYFGDHSCEAYYGNGSMAYTCSALRGAEIRTVLIGVAILVALLMTARLRL